jgi:hypothetical protein
MLTPHGTTSRSLKIVFTSLALALLLFPVSSQPASADAPTVPHQFFGTVTINGSLAAAGYAVTAKVSGTEVATGNTDSSGRYGYNPLIMVATNAGTTIDFYVNGVKAAQTATFTSGEITLLNLTVSGTVRPPSTPVALNISTSSLPSGTINSAYSTALAASGGTSPYTWSVTSGSLPAGLTLSAGSGVISGTPTATQTASFTVQVSDSASGTSIKSFSMQVNAASTPAQSVTISASVLGQTGSFSATSGVVGSTTSFSSADGRVQFNFIANTAINITGQSLTVTTEPSPPSPPSDAKIISSYNFTPNNTTFSPGINVTLKYDPAALPSDVSESNLYIAYWSGASWIKLTTEVNTQSKTLTTQVSHFTIFAIMAATGTSAPPASAASFSVSNLSVSSVLAAPGEQVTISAQVTNTGGTQGSYNAILNVNDVNEAEKEITLAAGKTGTVTFTINEQKVGVYNITVGGQSKSFMVNAAKSGSSSGPFTPINIAVFIGALIVILILIAMIRRQSSY